MGNTRTTTQPAIETFEIISSAYAIKPHDANGPALFGQLAAVPGKGRLARTAFRGRAGQPLFAYYVIEADRDLEPRQIVQARDEVADLICLRQDMEAHPRKRLTRMTASPLEAEVERFGKDWPNIVEVLGLRRVRPVRVFNPGDVYFPALHDPQIGEIEWQRFLDLHVSGDFGDLGRYDPSVLDDPATVWSIGIQPTATRNAFAIQSGCGVVRSSYPIPGRPDRAICVASALMGGGFTILHIGAPPSAA